MDPPSGSVIANFEDTTNASTIVCNISHGGRQISTQWTVANFRGDGPNVLYPFNIAPELFSAGGDPIPNTDFLFNNELTFLTWAAELDGVIIYCGTGQDPQQASFTLRIYSELVMQLGRLNNMHACMQLPSRLAFNSHIIGPSLTDQTLRTHLYSFRIAK